MEQKVRKSKQFHVEWRDSGREPQCRPDPKYPNGIDVDVSGGAVNSCIYELPYPAKRCGVYIVTCKLCGFRGGCTTAGRPDDPRSIEVPCKMLAATKAERRIGEEAS